MVACVAHRASLSSATCLSLCYESRNGLLTLNATRLLTFSRKNGRRETLQTLVLQLATILWWPWSPNNNEKGSFNMHRVWCLKLLSWSYSRTRSCGHLLLSLGTVLLTNVKNKFQKGKLTLIVKLKCSLLYNTVSHSLPSQTTL